MFVDMLEGDSTVERESETDNSTSNGITRSIERIDGFFEENRHLFTLIGVFGAITIYLTEAGLPETQDGVIPYENFVFAGGFGIVLILGGLILLKLANEIWTPGERISKIDNLPFICFGLLFFFLMIPVIAYVSSYNRVWFSFFTILSWIIGIMTFFIFLDMLREYEVPEIMGEKIGMPVAVPLILISIGVALGSSMLVAGIQSVFGEQVIQQGSTPENIPSYFWLYNIITIISIWFALSLFMMLATIVVSIFTGIKRRAMGY